MEDNLLNNIINLQIRLRLVEQKLEIALEGLKVISDNSDNLNIASKTLDEIENL